MDNDAIRALTLIEVRDALAAGDITAEAVVLAALEQAERYNREYNLFITYTPELALEKARAADRARSESHLLGYLHGVPITIKDNIDTAGLLTTGGAKFFKDRVPSEDATVVAQLEAAGAISIGKTNLHELALGGTSINPHYGPVRNPWAPDRIPGGSSGGAGAVQALNIGYAALGTDSGGSVRIPAALCGLVGLKQTHGLVSLKGCMPTGAWSNDHIGPLTKNVADAALMLSLMQGYDPADPDSVTRIPDPAPGLTSLAGLKFGLPETFFWEDLDEEVEKICLGTVGLLKEAGAEVVPVSLKTLDMMFLTRSLMAAELYVYHEPYLKAHFDDYGLDTRNLLLAGQFILAQDYVRGSRIRRLFMEEFGQVLESVDAIVTPTVPIPAHLIEGEFIIVKGKKLPLKSPTGSFILARNTYLANQAGVPAISIPAGLTSEGLPVGFQMMAAPFQDYKLLEMARLLESKLGFKSFSTANVPTEVLV